MWHFLDFLFLVLTYFLLWCQTITLASFDFNCTLQWIKTKKKKHFRKYAWTYYVQLWLNIWDWRNIIDYLDFRMNLWRRHISREDALASNGILINSTFVPNILNTLRPRQMAAIFQTAFSNAVSWMKMYKCRLWFHWSLFLRVLSTISQHWFR